MLDLWEIENAIAEEREASVRAVREALDDMQAGDHGTPVDEFLAEVRRRLSDRGPAPSDPAGSRRP